MMNRLLSLIIAFFLVLSPFGVVYASSLNCASPCCQIVTNNFQVVEDGCCAPQAPQIEECCEPGAPCCELKIPGQTLLTERDLINVPSENYFLLGFPVSNNFTVFTAFSKKAKCDDPPPKENHSLFSQKTLLLN